MVHGKLIDSQWITSVTVTSSITVDDGLRGETDGDSHVSEDVDSVGKRRGGTLSPARAAILGNMLVLVPREVVDSADVSPIP